MLNLLATMTDMFKIKTKEKIVFEDAYNLWRNEYRRESFDYIHSCLVNNKEPI